MKILRLAVLVAHAPALFGAYQYYQSDTFGSLNSTNWWVNGGAVATSQGLSSNGNAALISNLAIPDGSWDYEVKLTLNLADNSVGDLLPVIYLRDQGNPLDSGAIQYYSIEIDASSSTGSCSYSLYKHYTDSGGVHDVFIAQGGGSCHNGSTIRSVIYTAINVDSVFAIYIDDQMVGSIFDASGVTYGAPGVGIKSGCLSGCGGTISRADIGPKDRVNPNPVNVASIGTTVWANRMDAQWTAATDDANGIGVALYGINRNGTFIAYLGTTFDSDPTLVPGTTYAYTIYTIDFHGNWSTGAGFSVTTPGTHPNPAIAIPPARIGVRPTGAYWGAGGEQIDTLSGNLNFNLPLLKAKGRGGSAVTLGLSYNSQLWRQDSGGTWGYGLDVGFGFGWQLMVGSIAGYWSDPYTLDHYVFTDSTGADYALRVNTNGIWTSTEGIYPSYDPNGQKLYFPDGTVWTMGCTSGGSEPDLGWQYPTTIEDTNGNQIFIRYQSGAGVGYGNSSARIVEIEDVRATYSAPVYRTYSFSYNSDPTPHLTGISNQIGTPESYTFSYAGNQILSSPFSPPVSYGTTTLLQGVTNSIGLTHTFEYAGSSAELSRVVFPYGGYIRWQYRSFVFNAGKTTREVQYRYLVKAAGAPETTYQMWRDGNDANRDWHLSGSLFDPTGAIRNWTFALYTGGWWNGLLANYSQQQVSGGVMMREQDFGWAQDPAGNPYISSVVTTLDPTTYNSQSKTTQTLDAHGNVTQTQIYDFGNLSTPARTYTNTYVTDSNYTSRNIWNRLVSSTVTTGSQSVQLVYNRYDTYSSGYCSNYTSSLYSIANLREHDVNYGQSFSYRGNITVTDVPAGRTCLSHHITGDLHDSAGVGGTASATPSAATNYAAPGVITANNFLTTLAYSAFLGVTSATGQNNDSATMSYDAAARPLQSTSPYGAVTNYSYTNSPPTSTATTNGHWVRTTADGLGRTVRVETGDGGGTKSTVDT